VVFYHILASNFGDRLVFCVHLPVNSPHASCRVVDRWLFTLASPSLKASKSIASREIFGIEAGNERSATDPRHRSALNAHGCEQKSGSPLGRWIPVSAELTGKGAIQASSSRLCRVEQSSSEHPLLKVSVTSVGCVRADPAGYPVFYVSFRVW
jgi:hypothetical protein